MVLRFTFFLITISSIVLIRRRGSPETTKPFLIRCSGRDILAALDLITFSLQAAKQFFQVGTGWQKSVNGSFQLCLIAGAVLRGLMFNIALALVLSRNNDRQTMFLAKPVGGAADIVITPLVGTVIQRPSANGDGQALRCRSLPQ